MFSYINFFGGGLSVEGIDTMLPSPMIIQIGQHIILLDCFYIFHLAQHVVSSYKLDFVSQKKK